MTIGESSFPTALDSYSNLVRLGTGIETFLLQDIAHDAMELRVGNPSLLQPDGIIRIGGEYITYTSIIGDKLMVETRGAFPADGGYPAQAHRDGDVIVQAMTPIHHRVVADAIRQIEIYATRDPSILAFLAGIGTRVVEVDSVGQLSAVSPLGSVHLNRTPITAGQSACNIDGVFSADYDDYFIDFRVEGAQTVGNGQPIFQLRSTGVTIGGTGYHTNGMRGTNNIVSGYTTSAIAQGFLGALGMYATSPLPFQSQGYICSPFRASRTSFVLSSGGTDNAGARVVEVAQGVHDVAESYDGIRFSITAGAWRDGEINIHGLRKP